MLKNNEKSSQKSFIESGNTKDEEIFISSTTPRRKISSYLSQASTRRNVINDKTFAISKILFCALSLHFHHKIYVLHDDDYVVIALPFDDVTDNLSLMRRKKT
ncbi:CLUMA_CG016055, isoform A [Clunio marinus]|uniref:CLUMA_CG016055, isoform A n=1 Tax=Clunio marinus TaxID=568069 RepID=A0A1J1ISS8_9DIPT|nr:CLUMA_CG016055, isoform A [Clunio marinus]